MVKIAIGVSAGTEVVCAALVVVDYDGSHTVEYRTVSADGESNTDVGSLVVSAVELMASLAPAAAGSGAHSESRQEPAAIAVSYRTAEHGTSIRSALGHAKRNAVLVPEAAAAHAFLDDAGLIARYRTVAIVDVGATGTTSTIMDSSSGHVHVADRTRGLSGDVATGLVGELVRSNGSAAGKPVRDDIRDSRGSGFARFRAVKEHLSTHDSAEISSTGGTFTIERAAFNAALRPHVAEVAHTVERIGASVDAPPEAVVLIGGGANIPVIRRELDASLAVLTITLTEPDTVLAKGAALLSLSGSASAYPTIGFGTKSRRQSIRRFSGALVGALAVGAIVLAYGLHTLTPSDRSSISPAGSVAPTADNAVTDRPVSESIDEDSKSSADEAYPYGSTPPVTRNSRPTTTPTLHPAPDLSVIPWPAELPPDASTMIPAEPNMERSDPETAGPDSGPPNSPAPDSPAPDSPAPDPTVTRPTVPTLDPTAPDPTTPEPTTPEPTTPEPTTPDPTAPDPTTPDPTPSPDDTTPALPTTPAGPTESPTTDAPQTGVDSSAPTGAPTSPDLSPPDTVWTPATQSETAPLSETTPPGN